MPDYIVVNCFSCKTFQVIQDKKSSNKFVCSICHEKQSVRKVFHSSSYPKDCRIACQTLNMERGRVDSIMRDKLVDEWENNFHSGSCGRGKEEGRKEEIEKAQVVPQHQSRWITYIDHAEDSHLENLQCEDDPRFVTALPERKARVKSGQVAAKGEGRRCRGDGNTAGGVREGKWEGGRGAKRSHDTFLSDDEDDCRAGGFTGLGVQARKVTSGGACVGVGRGKDSGKTRRTEDVGFEAGKSWASCTGGAGGGHLRHSLYYN